MTKDKSYRGRVFIQSIPAIFFGNRMESIATALDVLGQEFFMQGLFHGVVNGDLFGFL